MAGGLIIITYAASTNSTADPRSSSVLHMWNCCGSSGVVAGALMASWLSQSTVASLIALIEFSGGKSRLSFS